MADAQTTPTPDAGAQPDSGPPPSFLNFNPIGVHGLDSKLADVLFSDFDATEVDLDQLEANLQPDSNTGYQSRSFTEAGFDAPDAPPDTTTPHIDTEAPPATQTTEAKPADPAAPQTADAQQQELQELRAAVEEMRQVAEFMSSITQDEFEAARLVATEFKRDPATFIRTYVPQIVDELVAERYAAEPETDPRSYAEWYAEQQLVQKYGEEFVPNPAEMNLKGSESYNYAMDQHFYLNEGYNQFHAQRQAQQKQMDAEIGGVANAARTAAESFGLVGDQFIEVMKKADAIESTPQRYYEMLFTWMRANNMLPSSQSSAAGPTAVPAGQIVRRPDAPPVASLAQNAGSDSRSVSAIQELMGDFPADYVLNGIKRGR